MKKFIIALMLVILVMSGTAFAHPGFADLGLSGGGYSFTLDLGSVDLILTDLPYGIMKNPPSTWDKTKTEWDTIIKPKSIFDIANRILRKNGKLVLFSQEPYTTKLITEAIPNIPFSYRAIWEKDSFANALGVNVNMVSFTEDILVFSKKDDPFDGHELRDYFAIAKERIEKVSAQTRMK